VVDFPATFGILKSMQAFTGIKKLLTLQGVLAKAGRHAKPEDLSEIKNAAILEDHGRILWVGEEKKLSRYLKEQSLPAKKVKQVKLAAECALPAFIDCHTHLIFAGDRKSEFELRNQGISYQEIAARGGGIRATVRATRKAMPAQLKTLAEARLTKLLQQGVTTVEIKSGYGLSHKDEIKILKVARSLKTSRVVTTYLGAHATPEDQPVDQYFSEMIEKTLPEIRRLKLADRVDMFIEKGYFTIDQAKVYFERARELGLQICGHTDQMTHSGASVFLSELGATSVDHVVQIDEHDIDRLAKTETTCVCLPTSDLYLKMKYPPARQLIDRGARVAISTDFNPGTSPCLDFSLLGVLSRLEMRRTLPEVLAGLTVNAAYALALSDRLGALKEGYLCDFITLNGDYSELFYEIGLHPVNQVICAGKLQKLKKS